MTAPVRVRREGALGRLTLDRPRALNALTREMIDLVAAALDAWEHDDAVRAVLVDGGERPFCAGGDVRFLAADAGGPASAELLAAEYRLDNRIAEYPKPYVALMDGVVMGGGVGISAHGSLRVVTGRSVVALPEVTIGYVPDTGATWLLGHAPGETGMHVALTAARLGAADAIFCGLADVCVPADRLPELVAALAGGADPDAAAAALAVDPGPAPLARAREWIDHCYAAPDLPGILAALRAGGQHYAADAIGRAAPLAATLTLRALRDARGLPGLREALRVEYLLSRCCVRWPDFAEGVRAVLVDRDGAPRWDPPTLDEVTPAVETAFLELTRPDDAPLTF